VRPATVRSITSQLNNRLSTTRYLQVCDGASARSAIVAVFTPGRATPKGKNALGGGRADERTPPRRVVANPWG